MMVTMPAKPGHEFFSVFDVIEIQDVPRAMAVSHERKLRVLQEEQIRPIYHLAESTQHRVSCPLHVSQSSAAVVRRYRGGRGLFRYRRQKAREKGLFPAAYKPARQHTHGSAAIAEHAKSSRA